MKIEYTVLSIDSRYDMEIALNGKAKEGFKFLSAMQSQDRGVVQYTVYMSREVE